MATYPTDKWRGILGGLAEEIGAAEDAEDKPVRASRAARRRFFVRSLDREPTESDAEARGREGG